MICLLRLNFFFPGTEYRAIYKKEVFDLVYYGGGGFSWSEVMDMPISERRLNIKYLNEHFEKVQEAQNPRQVVTADKPLLKKPPTVNSNELHQKPSYTSKVKPKR